MGNTDSIPVLSQAKSGVQLLSSDKEGATRTQQNFVTQCPGVSQVTSLYQLSQGDKEGALDTQKACVKNLSDIADGIPLLGHVKGAVHYGVGDKGGGDSAIKSATRTSGVVIGGVGGFFVGGPVGAVAGGVSFGILTDVGTTLITDKPSGYMAAVDNARKNPNAGDLFDLALMPLVDGLVGNGGGNLVQPSKQVPTICKLATAKNLHAEAAHLQEIGVERTVDVEAEEQYSEQQQYQDTNMSDQAEAAQRPSNLEMRDSYGVTNEQSAYHNNLYSAHQY